MSATPQPTPAQRRDCLALACRLDRLNMRLALRPTALERLSLTLLGLSAPLLPGRIGRWARAFEQGTKLLRGVYEAVSR